MDLDERQGYLDRFAMHYDELEEAFLNKDKDMMVYCMGNLVEDIVITCKAMNISTFPISNEVKELMGLLRDGVEEQLFNE